MRRYKALAVGFALLAAILGPGVGSAAAITDAPDAVYYTSFICTPSGGTSIYTVAVGPTTTDSFASISPSNPSADWLACEFSLVAAPVQVKTSKFGVATPAQQPYFEIGGDCSFDNVTFSHRIYIVDGSEGSLLCWGGSLVD